MVEAVLAGLSILVVDDEMDCRELVATIIERAGAKVVVCSSVLEALDALDREVPDVIVSDIAMPVHDGLSFARKLRARTPEAGGDVPAIAVTAYTRDEDRRAALAAGFTMHLGKPVEPKRLIELINEAANPGPVAAVAN